MPEPEPELEPEQVPQPAQQLELVLVAVVESPPCAECLPPPRPSRAYMYLAMHTLRRVVVQRCLCSSPRPGLPVRGTVPADWH